MVNHQTLLELKELFGREKEVVFCLLFGSRVRNGSPAPRDWDFAVFWNVGVSLWERLGLIEELRGKLAKAVNVAPDQIDLVDVYRAGLSISSSVVESGVPLKGEGGLALEKFYQRVWALEEEFYWRLTVENRRISG